MKTNALLLGLTCCVNSFQHLQITRRGSGVSGGGAQFTVYARMKATTRGINPRDEADDGSDSKFDFDSISDEETLLACRAYLQRRNRINSWTAAKKRKQLALQSSAQYDSTYGYFWEDPEELAYWNSAGKTIVNETTTADDEVNEAERLMQNDIPTDIGIETHDVDEDREVEEESPSTLGNDFTEFPLAPPVGSKRRSLAQQKKWKDPQWKAKWYEKRWGSKQYRAISKELAKQKKMVQRIKSLPESVLASPELASMSNEEIADAIRTYVNANRKRSLVQKQQARNRKEKRNSPLYGSTITERAQETKTPRDILFSSSEQAMKEAQQKRAELAAKIYQKRVANQEAKQKLSKPKKPSTARQQLATACTPRDALIRIEADLDISQLPSVDDVKLVLSPAKLGRRKALLRRILLEHYGLRGKCVPVNLSNVGEDDTQLMFATKCSIEHLGNFVLLKMKE